MKRLRPLISLILLIIASFSMYFCESITFLHPSFDNERYFSDIRIVHQDPWYNGTNACHEDPSIWLTPNPNDGSTNKYSNIGKFVYKDRVQFKDKQSNSPQKVASFNTSFTFQIITTGPYNSCGSGMAFFISAFDKAPLNSHGGYLGLINPNETHSSNFFAVEFDTHKSDDLHDPSASHIGIDVGSLVSLNSTDTSPNSSSPFYPQLYLYNNHTFTAWIEYNSLASLIQVWMTNSSSAQRPPHACLQVSHNLSSIFEDFMYVGFTGTNKKGEDDMEGQVVYSWSFSSEDFVTSGPSTPKKNIINILVPIGSILTLGVPIITISLLHIKKQRSMVMINHIPTSIEGGCTLQRYTYKELKTSAQGFTDQRKVGEGGFSRVYKATLADGSTVAIKRLKESVRKEAEFCAEINIISSLRHRNLLQLRGWCYEKREAMLVYKYMSNGSLEGYLYGKKKGILPSEVRLKVLVGVASALEYLHNNLTACVLHRDVKAANVMLEEGFEPILGDFGLARLIGHDEGAVTMTAVGTPGYVAPEVAYTGKFTDKADVYSFGVLALAIASGRPAVAQPDMESEEAQLLVDYVWMLQRGGRLLDALDPSMCTDMTHMNPSQREEWRCVLHVALMCCYPEPESRPNMRQVSQALKGDSNVLLTQPLPASRPLYPANSLDWPSAFGSSRFSLSTALNAFYSLSDMDGLR